VSRRIEWPPGSGAVADYAPHEERLLRDLIASGQTGEIPIAELEAQVGLLHDAKALLGARVLPDHADLDAEQILERPAADSAFQIPASAERLLAR
jgi:hypothetical protein